MSEENILQNAICETDGCAANSKVVPVHIPLNSYLLCGECGNQIINISIIN